MAKNEKKRIGIVDQVTYLYIKRIKKWMFCPACKNGKMTFNKKKSLWVCEDCGYHFSEEYFLDDCVFWFCDECEAYLNNQKGFEKSADRHICERCGYENDTTFDNIKGTCVDCGKLLPNQDATLCADCREIRRKEAKKRIAKVGQVVGLAAVAIGAIALASNGNDNNAEMNYTPLPNDDDNDVDTDEEVYGLGDGNYPTCKMCHSLMTEFDGWAWYTCPNCQNKVRIIDGKTTWYDEIFKSGKKQHYSDFDLADFCRGGDLKED